MMAVTAIPQAAGITGILTAAGLTADEVHAWFAEPRRELKDLTPGAMLELAAVEGAGAAQLVLELVKADAARIAADRVRWEGTA